jgi:formate hydrogenlyase subunit 3/multisubunit Na+/H+ antiporter MnhD subunit
METGLQGVVLILALALPLGLAALWGFPGLRGGVGRLTPWAPLPALLLALFGEPGPAVQLDWVLLGSRFGLTDITRVFLLFTAVLWLGAGIYARGYLHGDRRRPRFELLWLITLTGNLALILALDAISFYAGFALMTFAAYGLVVHNGTVQARRAGRVYLAMAVLGEGLILAGLLLAAIQAGGELRPLLTDLPPAIAHSDQRDLLIALLLLGFGIKAGLPLLHVWLPLAHPVAPVPASAVLSGAMIKAGLLGWLHTLPLGLVSLPGWSLMVIGAGLVAAFGAAFLSLHQHHPKTVLAYSSVSQMGLITVGIGMALQAPALRELLIAAIAVYALHHGLSKGALFLGVGIARHPGRLAGPVLWLLLALPALSLAGVMTTGVVAKLGLKAALHTPAELPDWWVHLPRLLELAALGTTLIMARYLWLLRSENQGDRGTASLWVGWALVLAAGPALLLLPGHWGISGSDSIHASDWLSLGWPVLAGTALAVIGARTLRPWPIPPGDLLALITPRPETVPRIREAVTRAFGFMRRQLDPARILARLRPSDYLRPDRLWQRETPLAYAALLVLLLAATLL